MTKKKIKQPVFVTEEQWAENMKMMKDFFEKLFFEHKDFRNEQRQTNKEVQRDITEIKKNVEMNSDSLALLTKDLRKTEKLEYDIHYHDLRITKLEEKQKVKS